MIRICGGGEICLVAAVAGRRQREVVVVHVAACARRCNVSAGQREGRGVVIEGSRRPGGRIVAGSAGGWEACRGVRGTGGSIPVRLVAAVAGRRQRGVVVVHVAACAWHRYVRAGQWERSRIVIEGSRRPGGRIVASSARSWKTGGHMGRTLRCVVYRVVASVAGGQQRLVVVVHVATCARRCNVSAGQRKDRFRMIESG